MNSKRKVILSGMLGNGLEWYDYALYGHMSIVFSKLFFPAGGDESQNLILTLLIFASGFLARPLGAIFFGRIGDRYGRKRALTLSMIMMAAATGCIGLMPTYSSIGAAAPLLLTLIRIAQGLSLGGAYSGSISYVVEHAPPARRGVVGSVITLSLVIGFLIGSLVSTVVSHVLGDAAFVQWGWRLPFFLGIGIGFVGFYIRNHGEESPVYEQAKKDGALSENPVRDAFTRHPGAMLRAFMAYLFGTVPFYLIAVYMIAYSKTHLGLSESEALLINTLGMAAMALTIYPAARLSDRVGRKPTLLAPIAVMLLVCFPLFALMQQGLVTHQSTQALPGGATHLATVFEHGARFGNVLLGQVVLALLMGWYLGPIPATLVEIFPTSVRYTGMSLAYNLCAIVGGFTPSVAEALIRQTGSNVSLVWPLIGSGALSFLFLLTYSDRWREPLPE